MPGLLRRTPSICVTNEDGANAMSSAVLIALALIHRSSVKDKDTAAFTLPAGMKYNRMF